MNTLSEMHDWHKSHAACCFLNMVCEKCQSLEMMKSQILYSRSSYHSAVRHRLSNMWFSNHGEGKNCRFYFII
jgi:hypothetical protein